MVVRRAVRAAGNISDGVLVARFLADPGVKILQRFPLGCKIDFPAGVVRVINQPRELALKERAGDRNTIDLDRVVQQRLDDAVIRHLIALFSAVGAIGDQQNELAAIAAAVPQKLRRPKHRVIERLGRLPANVHRRRRYVRRIADGRMPVDGGRIGNSTPGRSGGRLRIELRAL